MDVVEQLKQVGLTQYEAEAYYTLLREGPLTGYQLGKRSKVPLPRSYDVLARLAERGLALAQPGDPPRYLAEDPGRLLNQMRARMTVQFDELEVQLTAITPSDAGEEFWIIRGRDRIRDRAAAMIRAAEQTVGLRTSTELKGELHDLVTAAGARNCRVLLADSAAPRAADVIVVLVDDETLIGTMTHEQAQAVVTRNAALVEVARASFVTDLSRRRVTRSEETIEASNDWLAWEEDKHRRLRLLIGGSDVA